jgi:hypothetical protein
MSGIFDEQGDINWKVVMDRLGNGQVVEIPCQKERDFTRRATQVSKRAERQDLSVEVLRGENALRIEPRAGAARASDASAPSSETREERRRERAQRREAIRAERGAELDQER